MEEQEKVQKLSELLHSGQLSPEVADAARGYISKARLNNPQWGATGPENIAGIEKAAPELKQRYEQGQAEIKQQEQDTKVRALHRAALSTRAKSEGAQTIDAERLRQGVEEVPIETLRAQYAPVLNEEQAKAQEFTKANPKLASATGIEGLYADPEYIPDPNQGTLAQRARGALSYAMMPEVLGGRIIFNEPDINEFREAFRSTMGDGVDALDETSFLYRSYADRAWKATVDQAKQTGQVAVRPKYAKSDNWKESVYNTIYGPVQAFGKRVASGVTLGTLPAGEAALSKVSGLNPNAFEALDRGGNPASEFLGDVVGMALPGSLAGRVWSGASGLAKKLPVGKVVQGTLAGAGAATLQGGAEDLTRAVAEQASGDKPFDIAEIAAPGGASETAKRALERAGMGGLFGLGGEVVGQAAGKARQRLRNPEVYGETARAVRRIDEAGGKLGVGGVKLPEEARTFEQRAAEVNRRPAELARQAIEGPMLEGALQKQEAAVRKIATEKKNAVASYGDRAVVPWNVIDSTIEHSASVRRAEGSGVELPTASAGGELSRLKEYLVGPPRVMPEVEAKAYIETHPNARIYSPEALQRAGIDVGKIEPGQQAVVVGRPMRAADVAKEYELVLDELGSPDPAAYRAQKGTKGYAGALREHVSKDYPKLSEALDSGHRALLEMENRNAYLGLPKRLGKKGEELSPEVKPGVSQRLTKLPETPEAEVAMRDVAQSVGKLPQLKNLWALLSKEQLQKGAGKNQDLSLSDTHAVGFIGRRWRGFRLGSDNIMKALAKDPSAPGVVDLVKSIRRDWAAEKGQGIENELLAVSKELNALPRAGRELKELQGKGGVREVKASKKDPDELAPPWESSSGRKAEDEIATGALPRGRGWKENAPDQGQPGPGISAEDRASFSEAKRAAEAPVNHRPVEEILRDLAEITRRSMQHGKKNISTFKYAGQPPWEFGIRGGRIGGAGVGGAPYTDLEARHHTPEDLDAVDMAILQLLLSIHAPKGKK